MNMNEKINNDFLKEMEESFKQDLSVVAHEYQSWGKYITENQGQLIDELKYAIGEHREDIISELQGIEKQVIKWNSFIESIIRKYSYDKKYVRKLEPYMYQPQK